ncbi:hypothetical protein TNCV_2140991 [Trichonephila clavipes]|uniref:Uncharacterized protein n=1 Tax=Trichonephila clavipes TaxID=2585209 RepID=A0A8X6RV03_TRICX|nr:hypothetical protein TNCV_2140991 [Trichonephila clavipes]
MLPVSKGKTILQERWKFMVAKQSLEIQDRAANIIHTSTRSSDPTAEIYPVISRKTYMVPKSPTWSNGSTLIQLTHLYACQVWHIESQCRLGHGGVMITQETGASEDGSKRLQRGTGDEGDYKPDV